jgi:acyl-CoA synthetase (AMP-forming)/AMP-acid ligase II
MSTSSAAPSGLIGDLLKHQLGRAPLDTALQYGTHKLSWRKLDSRVRHAATGLRAAMVRPGDRIGVLSPNHPACIEALFAAALTGTTAVLVNWWLPEEEITEILRTGKVKVLFVASELAEMLERIRPELEDLDSVVVIGHPGGDPHSTDDYELWLELHETGESMYESAQFHPSVDDPVRAPGAEPPHAAAGRGRRAARRRRQQGGVRAAVPDPRDERGAARAARGAAHDPGARGADLTRRLRRSLLHVGVRRLPDEAMRGRMVI